MTKSRTLRRAGAVVLSLAMAASTLFVAPDSFAASKKKVTLSSDGKTFGAAGGSATVKVKGAAAKKIKKTTLSSSNKAVATAAKVKSSKVKFKVTAKENKTTEVKKATITAKVVLKKKKFSKKVVYTKKTYKLKYKVTVEAAEEPPVKELKLERVESAGRIGTPGSQQVNILIGYFSSAISDLSTSDVEIRQVSNDKLYTVESIVMASDKKSATFTLTGSKNAATGTDYLSPDTPYKMIVKTSTATLEKEFVLPEVAEDKTVTSFNADKNTMTFTTAGTLDVSGLTIDPFELLGQNVTVEYAQGKASKITPLSKVVTGSFKTSKTQTDGKWTLTDINDSTKTIEVANNTVVNKLNKGANSYTATATRVNSAETTYPYLKICQNATATTIISVAAQDKNLVKSVNGNFVTNIDKVEKDFKDYKVIKDFKLDSLASLTEGTSFFVDTTNEIIIVGDQGVESEIETIFDDSVVISGTSYAYGSGEALDTDVATQLYIDGTGTTPDAAGLKKAKAGGKVKVYKDFSGNVAYITGTAGAAETTDDIYVVGSTLSSQSVNGVDYLAGTFVNDKETIDATGLKGLPLAGISKITVNAKEIADPTVAKIGAAGTSVHIGDIKVGTPVKITKDAKTGAVKELNFKTTYIVNYTTGTFAADTATTELSNSKTIKSGVALEDLVTSDAVTVYEYAVKDEEAATVNGTTVKEVKKSTLAEYTAKTVASSQSDADHTRWISSVVADGSKAKVIIVNKGDVESANSKVATRKQVIVTAIREIDSKLAEVDYIEVGKTEKVTVKSFDGDNFGNAGIVADAIVSMGFDDKGVVVTADDADAGSVALTTPVADNAIQSKTSSTITIGATTLEKQASTYVYKKDSTGYTQVGWTDMSDNVGKLTGVFYSKYQGVTGVVDTVVFSVKDVAYTPAQVEEAKIAGLALGVTEQTANGSASAITYSTAGITAATIDLTGATYSVTKLSGTGDFTGATATTISGTGITANDECKVTITTALGNTIEITVTAGTIA